MVSHSDQTRPSSGLDSTEAGLARDRAALLYDHGMGGVLVTAAAGLFLAFMTVNPGNAHLLLLWLCLLMLVLALRGLDILVLRPARRHDDNLDGGRETAIFALGMIGSAALWIAYPFLFYGSIGMSGRAAASMVVSALAGGSATVLGPSLPLALFYCAAQLLPSAIVFFTLPEREGPMLGLLAVCFLGAMVVSSRISHRSMTGALRLSRVNQALKAEAERQRGEVETANRSLAAAQVALHEANASLEERIALRTAELERAMAERVRYSEALARLASTDPLTGLCNRAHFAERLAHLLAAADAGGTELALLFVDLDNFKQVNDVRGHMTGDGVLQSTARRLRERAGAAAELARWGGDEFVLAAPAPDGEASAMELATRLSDALRLPMEAGLETVRVDATIGIAMFPADGRTQDELIRAADVAMYEGKKEGRNRIKLFDPALARNVAERHRLEQGLRGAIGRGELSLAFQPIVNARSGLCEAFEALLRWRHPQYGAIGPQVFVPVAEQTGQIGAIGRWVLHEACRAAARWPVAGGQGLAAAVTVNVSAAQVLTGTLLDDVEAALRAAGLPACRLQIEITESLFVADHVRVAPVFEALRRRGVRILLDDFGTGFSSLAYLGKLPIDCIKIDQSFVRTAEADGFAVISAILSIARAMSLSVTAEGVETSAQRRMLRTLGVDRLQGYLMSRPLPEEEVEPWLVGQHGPALPVAAA